MAVPRESWCRRTVSAGTSSMRSPTWPGRCWTPIITPVWATGILAARCAWRSVRTSGSSAVAAISQSARPPPRMTELATAGGGDAVTRLGSRRRGGRARTGREGSSRRPVNGSRLLVHGSGGINAASSNPSARASPGSWATLTACVAFSNRLTVCRSTPASSPMRSWDSLRSERSRRTCCPNSPCPRPRLQPAAPLGAGTSNGAADVATRGRCGIEGALVLAHRAVPV